MDLTEDLLRLVIDKLYAESERGGIYVDLFIDAADALNDALDAWRRLQ